MMQEIVPADWIPASEWHLCVPAWQCFVPRLRANRLQQWPVSRRWCECAFDTLCSLYYAANHCMYGLYAMMLACDNSTNPPTVITTVSLDDSFCKTSGYRYTTPSGSYSSYWGTVVTCVSTAPTVPTPNSGLFAVWRSDISCGFEFVSC